MYNGNGVKLQLIYTSYSKQVKTCGSIATQVSGKTYKYIERDFIKW